MKAPLPPGTAIDAQRRRRWTGNFSPYRHQVSDQSIIDWLDQFANDHRDVAARLLDAVDFYSLDRISGAFQTALAALPGWHKTAAQREGKWRFAGLSRSAGESADAMMHRFRVANGLDAKKYNELFIHPSQILLEKLGPDDTLVLIDDFVGTGESVCKAWEEREPIPDILIRGQLNLTPEQHQQVRHSIEQTNVGEQPVPRAFAPAVGMTAPPELKLTGLPQDLQQISGIGTHHQFARLERGTILIIGEERLVVAMIRPDQGRVGAAPPPPPGLATPQPAR